MFLNRLYRSFCFLFFVIQYAHGQHYQFSQFYASPTYLNPAFTGANVCSRVTANYRDQWAGLPGTFTTYQASVDHTLSRLKSGVGLQFFQDRAGMNGLTTTQVNFLYAYETKITKKLMARAGISAGSVQRRIDMGAFTFGDQIARDNASTSVESINANTKRYFDMSTGILLFTASAWGGIAVAHPNQPNQSLTGGNSKLPAEWRIHGGYKYVFDKSDTYAAAKDNQSITFAANYKKQAKFNQIDIGAYFSKKIMVIGCWYRGIPIFRPTKDYLNNDAIVFLLGVSIDKYNFGYSYDLTVSKLTNATSRGTHELSMSYQFCKLKKAQKRKLVTVSCPKF